MQKEELIKRYCEETNVLEDENNLVVIFYGSRTTPYYTNASDLDVFIIAKKQKQQTKYQLIDGIQTETIFITEEKLHYAIPMQFKDYNFYYENVFNGIVLKNQNHLVEHYQEAIKELEKNILSSNPYAKNEESIETVIEFIEPILKKYKTQPNNSNYYYLLYIISLSYSLLNNLPDIHFLKTYKFFNNPKYAKEQYKCELPPKDFCTLFLKALSTSENKTQYLNELLNMINYDCDEDYQIKDWKENSEKWNNNFKITKHLMELNHWIIKVEEMIVQNHPSKEYCYYVVLQFLETDYPKICGEDPENFNLKIEQAKNSNNDQERIDLLEELFHLINYQYEIDYDDYSL